MNTNKKILLEENEYELIENIREGFDEEELRKKYTEYFYPFDYIIGDWAYGKLRLKGLYDEGNKSLTTINNIKNMQKYIEENCAYNCRYFLIKKVYKK